MIFFGKMKRFDNEIKHTNYAAAINGVGKGACIGLGALGAIFGIGPIVLWSVFSFTVAHWYHGKIDKTRTDIEMEKRGFERSKQN